MGSNVAPLTLKVLEKRFRFDLAQHRFVAMSFLLIKDISRIPTPRTSYSATVSCSWTIEGALLSRAEAAERLRRVGFFRLVIDD